MYKKIYIFEVLDKITEGKEIYCCDKQNNNVICVNNLLISGFVLLLEDAKKDNTRFEFWTVKEGAENE